MQIFAAAALGDSEQTLKSPRLSFWAKRKPALRLPKGTPCKPVPGAAFKGVSSTAPSPKHGTYMIFVALRHSPQIAFSAVRRQPDARHPHLPVH